MNPSQPLQLHLTTLAELKLTAALHKRLQQRRHQNLTADSLRRYPRRQDHAPAEEVLALLDGLAGIEPDANSDGLIFVLSVVGGKGLLNSNGAL